MRIPFSADNQLSFQLSLRLLSSVALITFGGCSSPPRPEATSVKTARALPQAKSSPSLGQPMVGEASPSPSRGARLSCRRELKGCSALLAAKTELDQGHPSNAEALIRELESNGFKDGASEEVRSVHLIVRGRILLESSSLSYGEGGTNAALALGLFEEARKLSVHEEEATLQRCRALLALGRGGEAVFDLQRLAIRWSEDAEIQAALGIAYLSIGELPRSLEPLTRAARLDPKEPERWITLGTAQMLSGESTEAERSFRAALARDASSSRAHGDLGSLLVVMGRVDEGKQHLVRATVLAPRRASYRSNLSYAELLLGDLHAAEEQARLALSLDDRLASAWLNLGLVLLQSGDEAAARQSFERAAELDPEDPRPINNLRDLDALLRAKSKSP